MILEPFGTIEISKLEDCYEAEIRVGEASIEVDLNFESESVAKELIDGVEKTIANLKSIVKKVMSAISDDFDKGEDSETVMLYFEHHLEEFSSEEKTKIFGTTNVTKELFLENIKIRRIGFYPEDEESFVVVDAMLPAEYTDYLLVVTFNSSSDFVEISMES